VEGVIYRVCIVRKDMVTKISYMILAVASTKDNPDTVQMGGFKKRRTIKREERLKK